MYSNIKQQISAMQNGSRFCTNLNVDSWLCWVLPAERAVLSLQRVGAPVYLWRAAHAVAPVVALHGLGSCSS